MKKYTKKQIQESIKYWQNKLNESLNSSDSKLIQNTKTYNEDLKK